jgi:hypothetical protein
MPVTRKDLDAIFDKCRAVALLSFRHTTVHLLFQLKIVDHFDYIDVFSNRALPALTSASYLLNPGP